MSEKIEIYKPVIKQEDADFINNRLNCGTSKVDTEIDWISFAQFMKYKNKRKNLVSKAIFINDWEIEKQKHYVLLIPIQDSDCTFMYIYKNYDQTPSYGWTDSIDKPINYSEGFTKAEIKADEGLNKLAGVCKLVEVED